ncbi:cohesin domain-containing protein [Planctomycetota bacterium]
MRRASAIVGILCAFGVLVAGCSGSSASPPPGSAPAKVWLEASNTNPTPGEEITVDIMVQGAENLYGIAADLVYDKTVLRYKSASEGTLLKADGAETVFAAALQDGEEGRLVLGLSRTRTEVGYAGDGLSHVSQSVTFDVIGAAGVGAEVNLDRLALKDANLHDLGFAPGSPVNVAVR